MPLATSLTNFLHCGHSLPLRHGSYLNLHKAQLQEFVRIAFYYFVKNYETGLAWREMNENADDGVGLGTPRSSVEGVYALCRERVSRRGLKRGKMSGSVIVDTGKVWLRQDNSCKNEEFLLMGFIQTSGQRRVQCCKYRLINVERHCAKYQGSDHSAVHCESSQDWD